jgi:hypothetical protein
MKIICLLFIVAIAVFIPIAMFGLSLVAAAIMELQRTIFVVKYDYETENTPNNYSLFGYAKW